MELCLRSFLACAKDTGQHLLFIRAPHCFNAQGSFSAQLYEFHQRARRVGQIVEGSGFPFVNYDSLHEEIGLDDYADFSNPEHLCISGQRKFTRYLSRYLQEEYGLHAGEKTDEVQAMWERSDRYYRQYARDVQALRGSKNEALLELYQFESEALIRRLSEEIVTVQSASQPSQLGR